MDLIPKKRTNSNDGLGRGMEFAILVIMFLGIGYGLDRVFDTKPVFMITLVCVALVGQFASMRYAYEARMKELENERVKNTRVGKPAKRAQVS